MDSLIEAEITETIKEVSHHKKGLITVLVAHRLSTVMQMDRILVLEEGRVIDEGTHTDLIARDGLYQKFWNIQAGGFLTNGTSA